MPVIKADRFEGFPKDAIVLDLGDLGRQAAKLRSAAESRAAQILSEAEREAQRLVEGAEARGFEAGQAAGFEQGLNEGREQGRQEALAAASEELQRLQNAWLEAANQLDAQRREVDREARHAVLEFALKLAERLVHRVIEVDDTVVVDQVAQALTHVLRPLDVIVRIHPEDRPALEEAMPSLMQEFRNLKHVQIADDAGISRGGCVVTYGEGEIDATLETQLTRVIEMILPRDPGGEPLHAAADPAGEVEPAGE